MLPDGNNKRSKPTINDNVSCQESSGVDSEQTSTKVASQGSFHDKIEKDKSIVTGNDDDDDDDNDDNEEELFEESFSTPPEELPPQELKKLSMSPNEDYLSKKKESASLLSSLNLMFPSFVIAGLQRKVSILEIKSWINMSLSLDGRDKITKVLQYLSRFLAWWFLSKVNNPAYAAHGHRFTNFYKSLSISRKAFRLGRSIDELYKLVNLLSMHLKQYSRNKDTLSSLLTLNKLEYENLTSHIACSSFMSRILPVVRTTLTRSISSILDRMISFIPFSSNSEIPTVELWKATGSGLKMIALVGFYLGDNLNFLTSSGTLDNYSLSEIDRLSHRKQLQSLLGKKTSQSYFFASMVGLVMNAYSYHRFVQQTNKTIVTQEPVDDKSTSNDLDEQKEDLDEERERHLHSIAKKEKQFELFLGLLKSCMDVIVFSNNDGIDLHKKWRGRKNHEGFHCLCGLISAGTGLYSQFSDAKILL